MQIFPPNYFKLFSLVSELLMQSQIASRGEICPIQELNESLRVNLFFPCCWGFLGWPLRCSHTRELQARPSVAPLASPFPPQPCLTGPRDPVVQALLRQKMKTSWPCCGCFPSDMSGTRKVKGDTQTECIVWVPVTVHSCSLPRSPKAILGNRMLHLPIERSKVKVE